MPLFGPTLPVVGMPDSAVDTSALYAGETLHKISGIVSAAEAVASLV
jgi:uncharacterized membrane protein YadS